MLEWCDFQVHFDYTHFTTFDSEVQLIQQIKYINQIG